MLLKLAVDANLGALGAAFADDFHQALEGRDLEPVDLSDFLAVFGGADLADSDVKVGHRDACGGVPDFRIMADVADNGDGVAFERASENSHPYYDQRKLRYQITA